MPNVTISELPDAVIPLSLAETFFEVQTVESGVEVSRKVSGDNLTFSAGTIQGTGVADPTAGIPYDYDATLTFENANAIPTATWGWGVPNVFRLDNLAFGASVEFRGRTDAGVTISLLSMDPSGSTILGVDEGQLILSLSAGEINVHDQRSSTPNDLKWVLREGVGFTFEIARFGFDSSNDFSINNQTPQGHIILQALTGALAVRIGLDLDPDATSQLFHMPSDAAVLRTETPANGGIEVNNTATGAGFERVLTTADLGGGGSLDDLSDVTITAPATGSVFFKSAGDWINAATMLVNPGTSVVITDDLLLEGTANPQAISITPSGGDALGISVLEALGTSNLTIRFPAIGNQILLSSTGAVQLGDVAGSGGLLRLGGGVGDEILFKAVAEEMMVQVRNTIDWGFRNLTDEGLMFISGQSTASADVDMITADPDGSVDLAFNGTTAAQTTSQGLQLFAVGSGNAVLEIEGSGGGDAGINFEEQGIGTQLQIKWDQGLQEASFRLTLPGDNFRFFEQSTGDVLLEMTQGGGVDAYFDGRLVTRLINISTTDDALESTRLRLTSSIDASLSSTLHAFQVGSTGGLNVIMDINEIMARNNGAISELIINADGGSIFLGDSTGTRININDSANIAIMVVNENGIIVRANADVALFHNNVEVARSDSLANGGFEVNNTLTGAGFERVLTTSDLVGVGGFVTDIRTGNLTLADTTQVTALSVTLAANSRYAVEAIIVVLVNAADDFDYRFVEPSAGWDGNGIDVWTGNDNIGSWTEDTELTRLTSGGVDILHIKGEFTTDGTPGSLELQGAKNLDTGADGTLFNGSWLRAQLMT